jgi:hypothetical protein
VTVNVMQRPASKNLQDCRHSLRVRSGLVSTARADIQSATDQGFFVRCGRRPHAKIGELALEDVFLSGALGKAGLLRSARK